MVNIKFAILNFTYILHKRYVCLSETYKTDMFVNYLTICYILSVK